MRSWGNSFTFIGVEADRYFAGILGTAISERKVWQRNVTNATPKRPDPVPTFPNLHPMYLLFWASFVSFLTSRTSSHSDYEWIHHRDDSKTRWITPFPEVWVVLLTHAQLHDWRTVPHCKSPSPESEWRIYRMVGSKSGLNQPGLRTLVHCFSLYRIVSHWRLEINTAEVSRRQWGKLIATGKKNNLEGVFPVPCVFSHKIWGGVFASSQCVPVRMIYLLDFYPALVT